MVEWRPNGGMAGMADRMVKWRPNGKMVEWQNGKNGGMVKWRPNGGMVEWRNGKNDGMAEWRNGIWNGGMTDGLVIVFILMI